MQTPLKRISRPFYLLGTLMVLFALVPRQAQAEVIDAIAINPVRDQAEIQLHFITRIQYKRQVALKNGDVRIYVTLMDIEQDDPRLVWEKKESPPSEIVPPFTVTYPELDSSLTLSFGKAVKVRVRAGADGRSLIVSTKAIKPKKSEQAVLPVPTPVTAPAISPPVVAPVIAAAPSSPAATPSAPVIPDPAASATLPVPEPTGFATDLPAEGAQKTPEQIQQEAQQLFVAASDALQANQMGAAIEALNKVLNLPPNLLTQPAQALMGEAREKNGELLKARAEYELYLKLYPKAADAKQVQARIDKLPKEAAQAVPAAPATTAQKGADGKLKLTGGISQSFYHGVSQTDTFSLDSNNQLVKASNSETDLSRLLTNVDFMAQQRTETRDTRLVLRQYGSTSFLSRQPNDYRLNAAYVEQSARDRKYLFRLGRQSGTSGGMPGRFDGVAAGYSLNQTWRLNAAVGKPVEYVTGGNPADSKTFYSGSIDLTRLPDQWSGSAYGSVQYVGGGYKTGGMRERTALGLEAHYFDQGRSYMTQVELDTIYHVINLATFQGNWSKESGENYYLTLDHRRSPPLALNLQGQWTQSLKELIGSGVISLQTLRENSVALSPISNMFALGMSRPYSATLRLATDFRVSNTAGSGASVTTTKDGGGGIIVDIQPATASSGTSYVWSAQAIGNDLLFKNDLGIANYAYSHATTSKSHTLTFSQVATFKEKWRVDTSLLLARSSSSNDSITTQIRPSMTLNYRKSDRLSFSGEGGVEQFHSRGANSSDTKTFRKYFFLGYRWDFR
jgi:tetratricopeptide (TPR) repeat protein